MSEIKGGYVKIGPARRVMDKTMASSLGPGSKSRKHEKQHGLTLVQPKTLLKPLVAARFRGAIGKTEAALL